MRKNWIYFSVINQNVIPSMLFNHASDMAVWMTIDWSVTLAQTEIFQQQYGLV